MEIPFSFSFLKQGSWFFTHLTNRVPQVKQNRFNHKQSVDSEKSVYVFPFGTSFSFINNSFLSLIAPTPIK
jgi:hypothetical protein